MADSTAKAVTDAFVRLSRENRSEITNLKLQKLLYYAQAWYLVFNDRPLFDENIEAWVHGPVVPEIFRLYKHLRWSPIPDAGAAVDSENIEDHLREVFRVYGGLSATKLERLTHSEEPWKDARRGLPIDEPSRNVISPESMKRYYSTLLENA